MEGRHVGAEKAATHHVVIINKAATHAEQSLSGLIDVLAAHTHLAILALGPVALQLTHGSRPGHAGPGCMLCNLLICGAPNHLLGLVACGPAPVGNLLAAFQLWISA